MCCFYWCRASGVGAAVGSLSSVIDWPSRLFRHCQDNARPFRRRGRRYSLCRHHPSLLSSAGSKTVDCLTNQILRLPRFRFVLIPVMKWWHLSANRRSSSTSSEFERPVVVSVVNVARPASTSATTTAAAAQIPTAPARKPKCCGCCLPLVTVLKRKPENCYFPFFFLFFSFKQNNNNNNKKELKSGVNSLLISFPSTILTCLAYEFVCVFQHSCWTLTSARM